MNVKNKKFINVQRRIIACALAVLTIFGMNTGVFSEPMIVNAGSSDTLAKITSFGYNGGSVQTYTVPADGTYILEVAGAPGGDSGESNGGPNFKGGNGGYVKCSIRLKAGDVLYAYVGQRGDSLGDQQITPGNINGAGSGGGGSKGRCAGAGGGASEIRINGTTERDRLVVAGGGGGGIQNNNKGIIGGNGGAANSGNANSSQGATAGSYGAGGGGGYRGGSCGSLSVASVGGSNYVANSCIVAANGTNPTYEGSYIRITQCTDHVLIVDPNEGIWQGTKNTQTFTLDQTYDVTANFGYTGGVQTWKVPYTGYYYIEAWGGGGGNDASRGGYGGYVQSYTYLDANTTLSVVVGGSGWQQNGVSYNWSSPGGYNGGAGAGRTGSSGDYSGTGGGATHIALNNRNAGGNNPLSGYSNYKNEVLVVAGGGAGGSAESSGQGGAVLYTGNGTSYPGTVFNRASTGLLNGCFAVGSDPGSSDGGGGGGGWVGGISGLDSAGHSAGGGASFINTNDITIVQGGLSFTSSRSIPISLTPDNHAGSGYAKIRFLSDTMAIPNPTRDGYTFTGWTLTGGGSLERTNLGVVLFHYGDGTSTLTANWQKIAGSSQLTVDPKGGIYAGSTETTVLVGSNGKTTTVNSPERFGYDFVDWEYQRIANSGDTWSKPVYTYGYETSAKLTAMWTAHLSGLTIDPNGGIYNGSTDKNIVSNLTTNDVISVGTPTRVGYIFQYWDEVNGSDGYLADDGWHPGTKDGYLKAVWEPITYTVHYEPNTPEGLTVSGTQPDQTHTYDVEKALATNAEYNEKNGYSIPGVKFLWWNTKPDGTGTTYTSGQVVKNLTAKQGDVITLYAQWMVTYTIEHYKENLDGSYTLADTDEYKLIPLTTWTAPLHDYPGWSQPASEPFTVGTTDTTLKFYYPLIHYKLTYDTQGGEWYEEQSDGTWVSVDAPPSEYTVLTPDIHVTRPDKVGYTFLGWTGTDVPSNTLDVVIPQGSLGDRSYTAHWEAQAYDVEVPVSVLFSVGHDGYASGVFDQKGDGNYNTYGYLNNNSLFPVQVTNVTFKNESDYVFTHDKTLDETNRNIMNWRLDIQNGDEWNQYAPELLEGIDTDSSDIFWMAQNGNGHLKMNVDNAWAIHNDQDIKEKEQLGRIVWTFGIGHRNVTSRSIATME